MKPKNNFLKRITIAVLTAIVGVFTANAQSISADQTSLTVTQGVAKKVTLRLTSASENPVRDIQFSIYATTGITVSDITNLSSVSTRDISTSTPTSFPTGYTSGTIVMLSDATAATTYDTGDNVEIVSFTVTAAAGTASGTINFDGISISNDAATTETVTQDAFSVSITALSKADVLSKLKANQNDIASLQTTIGSLDSYTSVNKSKYMVDVYSNLSSYNTTAGNYISELTPDDYEFTETAFNTITTFSDGVTKYTGETCSADVLNTFNTSYVQMISDKATFSTKLSNVKDLISTETAYTTASSYLETLDATSGSYKTFQTYELADVNTAITNIASQTEAVNEAATSAIVKNAGDAQTTIANTDAYTDGVLLTKDYYTSLGTIISNAPVADSEAASPENYDTYITANKTLSGIPANAAELADDYSSMKTSLEDLNGFYTSTYVNGADTTAHPVIVKEAKKYDTELNALDSSYDPAVKTYLAYSAGSMGAVTDSIARLAARLEASVPIQARYTEVTGLFTTAETNLSSITSTLNTEFTVGTNMSDINSSRNMGYKYRSLQVPVSADVYNSYAGSSWEADSEVKVAYEDFKTILTNINTEITNARAAEKKTYDAIELMSDANYNTYTTNWNTSDGIAATLKSAEETAKTEYDNIYSAANTALDNFYKLITGTSDATTYNRYVAKNGAATITPDGSKTENSDSYEGLDLAIAYYNRIKYKEISVYGLLIDNVQSRTRCVADSLTSKFIADSYADADITMDEKVNVGDYTMLVNYVLDRNSSQTNASLTERYKANVNNDKAGYPKYKDSELYQPLIDASDITYVANILMGKSNAASAASAKARIARKNDVLGLELVSEDMGVRRYAVTLQNKEDYSAFQFDVKLNGDIVLADRCLSARANGQKMSSNELSNGATRVLACGLNAEAMTGEEGAIAYLDVMGEGEVELSNVHLSTPYAKSVALNGLSISTTGNATAVSKVTVSDENSNDAVYTLSGVKTSKLQKGINIVNGRKVIK